MSDTVPPGENVPEGDVDLEKTRLLFRNAGMAQAVTVINGGVLLFILGGLSPPRWALGWWLFVAIVAIARYRLAHRFLAGNPTPATASQWRKHALSGALVAGLVWGGGGTAMMVADPASTRLFTALVTAGMVAGAVPILSAVPAAFRAYAAPVMLAIIVTALADSHGPRDWMLALVATLYLLALLRSARYFHDSLDQSIRLALRMRNMARQLDKARQDAEAASAAKSRFLATMSHEIRTPLNGVLGMAQVLLMPGLTEAEQHEYARTILNSGKTLLTLLNDILDLSKVEAGKFELTHATFNPEQLVMETAALFIESAHDKGLALETGWQGPESPRYQSDPNRLRQMLSNLTNNAVKFTPQGTIRIEAAEVERSDAAAVLEFSVTDTGIGIAADKRQLLFQPFSQVDGSNTRQFGGTGLGLSIVRSLAQLMGGDVGVESATGQGSRFWFRIRAELVQAGEESREEARNVGQPADAGAGDLPLPPHRVLVVEDNAVNRSVVERLLKKLGQNVECVENGKEALRAITAGLAPDLVLMDCHMPIMDGFEATRRIREWEGAQGRYRLPIVALTASAFGEDRNHCLGAGMDAFLAKPVSVSDLHAMLATWARKSTANDDPT